jgi:hypothetical protein
MDPFWNLCKSSFGASAPMNPGLFGCLNGYHNPFPHYGGGLGLRAYSGGLGKGYNIGRDSLRDRWSHPLSRGSVWWGPWRQG